MFGLYFSRYLLENDLVKTTDIDDMANLPCQAFLDKFAARNCLAGGEAERYLAAFKKEYGFTDDDIEAINSGDMERIVPVFIYFDATEAIDRDITAFQRNTKLTDTEMETLKSKGADCFLPDYIQTDATAYNNFVQMTIESVVRSISPRVILKKARRTRKYAFEHLACQELKGTHHVFLGIAGKEESLLTIAGILAGKCFSEMNKIARGSICEFINRINGLYASRFSTGDVFMNLVVPYWHSDKELTSNADMYCLPVTFDDTEVEFVFSFDNDLDIR